MAFLVVGVVEGERTRSGHLDDGKPWSSHEIAVRDDSDFESTIVKVNNMTDPVPARGEIVALAAELRFGKVHALRRVPAIEAALTV